MSPTREVRSLWVVTLAAIRVSVSTNTRLNQKDWFLLLPPDTKWQDGPQIIIRSKPWLLFILRFVISGWASSFWVVVVLANQFLNERTPSSSSSHYFSSRFIIEIDVQNRKMPDKRADEKNDPDIIPHDNSDDEKDFERLYTPTQLNYVNRHSPNSHSPTLRFGEKQVRESSFSFCDDFAVSTTVLCQNNANVSSGWRCLLSATPHLWHSNKRSKLFSFPQYGELSLTTNPGFALYNNPTIRKYNVISSSPTNNNNSSTTTTILRSKSPPNIYTRLPMKEYPSVSLTPTPMSPQLMTSSIVGYNCQGLSPTKHLLVTTTPFMENGGLTTTATNLATADKCILSSVRMPLLNVNYKAEINNRINNGIVSNGSAISQLTVAKESWKCFKDIFATVVCWTL